MSVSLFGTAVDSSTLGFVERLWWALLNWVLIDNMVFALTIPLK